MKDELNGIIMTHFIDLRSKMYSFLTNENKSIKKPKGIKSNVVKNSISFKDYKHCLENKDQLYRTQRNNIFSVEQTKIALSSFDDKREI